MVKDVLDLGLLSTTEAAGALRISYQTILAWIKSGRVPAVKIGKSYKVPRAALEKMMEQLDTSTFTMGTRFIIRPGELGNAKMTGNATITATMATEAGESVEGNFSLEDLKRLNDAAGANGEPMTLTRG